jgi:hypothetical protein
MNPTRKPAAGTKPLVQRPREVGDRDGNRSEAIESDRSRSDGMTMDRRHGRLATVHTITRTGNDDNGSDRDMAA